MNRKTSLLGWAIILLVALFLGRSWLPAQNGMGPPAATSAQTDVLQSFAAEEREAIQQTLGLIERGGPFPYGKDGSEFSNREGRLPAFGAGYYREYTVDTPGSSDRGARRIVAGRAGEIYYSDDHYRTFVRLR